MTYPGRSIDVLHVDDDAMVLEFVEEFIKQAEPDMIFTRIESPREALELLRSRKFDCIISDYKMPDLNGIQLAQKIRQLTDSPIILYTGQGSEEVAEQAYSVGINDYIRKENHPAHYQVLAKRIRHVVEMKRAEKALRESEERYRALVDNSPNAISVTIGEKIIYANRSRAELAGVDNPEKLIGASIDFQVEMVDKEAMIKRRKVRESGMKPSTPFSFRLVSANSGVRDIVDYSSEIMYGSEKAVQHMLIDVTEHRKYEERLEALHRNELELIGAETLEDVAKLALNAVERTLGFYRCGFGFVEGDILRFSHIRGVEGVFNLPLSGRGITVRAVKTGLTQFVSDIRMDHDYVVGSENMGYEALSEIAVPVKVGDEVAAVLNVENSRLDAYTSEDGRLLEILAEHVASTIRMLKEKERLKRYEARLETLHRNANELQSASDIQQICECTLDAMEHTLGFKNSSLQIVTEKGLKTIDARGAPLSDTLMPLSGRGITVRAANTRQPILVSDIRTDPDFVEGSTDSLSKLAVPVIAAGEAIGVINVESLFLDAFTEEDKRLLETLAQHVGSAIGRINSLELERSYKKKLEVLSSHASKLARCIDLSDVAKTTLETIHSVIGAGYGSFALVKGDKLSFIARSGTFKSWRLELPLDGPGITVRAARLGEAQLICDTRLEKDYLGSFEPDVSFLSELAVPVKIDNEVKAVINLESMKANDFTEDDKRLLSLFAEHVASAISRIEQMKVIRVSEEKYRKVLDSSPESVFLISGMKFLYVNNHMAKLLGYDDASELIGQDLNIILTDDEKERTRQRTLSRQRGEPQPNRYEISALRKDGTLAEAELAVSLTEYEGKPAVLAFARDISDRKLYQAKLTQLQGSGRRLAGVSTRDEVWDATIETVTQILGFDFVGIGIVEGNTVKYVRSIGGELPKDWSIDLSKPSITSRAIETAIPQLVRDTSLDPDYIRGPGMDRSLSELAIPIIVDGHPVAVLNIEGNGPSMFTEADMCLIQILVGQVSSALDHLTHLEEEIKRLETRQRERLEGVERMSGMVRHDLRGPLQTIQSASYLLRRRPERVEELTRKIDESVEYAVRILEDLKVMTKPEALNRVLTNLGDLVEKCLDFASIPATVSVVRDLAPISLEVDQYRIRRVLDNLIKNAVEAMPDGGTMTLRVEAADGMALLMVRDTGRGMTDEVARNLFTPFYTTKQTGTGLGLAICKQVVEAHGGRITFESRAGKGTTFTVALPLTALVPSDSEGGSEGGARANSLVNKF